MADTTVAVTTSEVPDPGPIPTRVLVLGMAHEDGTIHGAELYPAAEAVGQTGEQVRSCLRRLVSEGLFVRDGAGRHAVFRATDAGQAAIAAYVERTRLAYVQDARGRGWDRKWRVVAFAVPEPLRAARDQLRDFLRLLGGAAMQGGLYVSPHPWLETVQSEAARLGVGDHVVTATTDDLAIGSERDPRRLAATLWPLGSLARRYEEFNQEWGSLPDELDRMRARRERIPEESYLAGALSMVMAFRHCFDHDPLLPPELLPRPWPGRRAREIVADSHRLALLTREEHTHPALFRHYADVAAAVR